MLYTTYHYPFTPHTPLPALHHTPLPIYTTYHYLFYITRTYTTTCFTPNTHTHHYLLYTTTHFTSYTPLPTLHHTVLPSLHHTPLPALHYTHCNPFFIMLYTQHHYLLYTTHTPHQPHCFCIVCFELTLVVKALEILLYITKTCERGQHTHTHMRTHTKLWRTCASLYLFARGRGYRIVLVYRMIYLFDINITIPTSTTGYFLNNKISKFFIMFYRHHVRSITTQSVYSITGSCPGYTWPDVW